MDAPDPARTTRIALLFEGGLGAVALLLGWLAGHWPFIQESDQHLAAVGWGLLATGPLLAALMLIDRFPLGPLVHVRQMAEQVILQMFGGATFVQLAAVSIAAGCGEELLFRGLVQAGLSKLIPGEFAPWIALAVASVLFGVCHWLNTTYALLAAFAGAYFGLLLLRTGSLWTPIVAHATYDFIALVYLIRPSKLLGSTV
jgi:membrane protease YdiL (CAAX protease family)